jgi:hypothetical protein
VRDSDATVVFTIAPRVTGGSALTLEFTHRLSKPALHLHQESAGAPGEFAVIAAAKLRAFLVEHQVRRLNVAGPRGSQEPTIGEFVRRVLHLAVSV